MQRILIYLILLLFIASCEEALERPLTATKVTLLAPFDSLITSSHDHTFYWERMEGATKYQLQIVSPKFDSIVQLVVDTTISKNTFMQSLSNGRYQWRVRALNNSTSSSYSNTWNLILF